MKKKVNVLVHRPIYTVKPAIIRNAMGIYLTIEDIKRCLWGKAVVEEILPTGEIIKLDLRNYDKVNCVDVSNNESDNTVVNVVEPKVEEEKVEEVVIEEPKEGKIEDINIEDIPVEEFESELNKTYEVNGDEIKEVKEEEVVNYKIVNPKNKKKKNKK